jgi:hypothetical protein
MFIRRVACAMCRDVTLGLTTAGIDLPTIGGLFVMVARE